MASRRHLGRVPSVPCADIRGDDDDDATGLLQQVDRLSEKVICKAILSINPGRKAGEKKLVSGEFRQEKQSDLHAMYSEQ